jgi:hypothetical protein
MLITPKIPKMCPLPNLSFPTSPHRRWRKPEGKAPLGRWRWRGLISEHEWQKRGASSSSRGGISSRSFAAALEGMARPTEMDAEAAAPDFFDDLGDCCAFKSGMTHVQGTRYGSAPHIHVVRAVVVVPAEISGLPLGAVGSGVGACRSS